MIDIYMNGAEVHAETPEEEREASLILSAALSGKKIPAGGCICPDQRDSTVGKGITMRFCDGTDMTITPTSDAEGNPELEIKSLQAFIVSHSFPAFCRANFLVLEAADIKTGQCFQNTAQTVGSFSYFCSTMSPSCIPSVTKVL